MIGHSIGEFVAACLAGVFSLEDGLKLVATRGQMMGDLPGGSMLSVRLPAHEVEPRLSEDLAIAAVNGPFLCVVSGSTDAVTKLQQELEQEEVACRSLHTSHAFHSPMMDAILGPFTELVKTIPLAAPQIPFVSTVTADWITDAQATDPLYWASHLRATVRFAEGVQTLWQQPRVLLEVGPRTTAATLARQQAKDLKQQVAISSLGSTADDQTEWTAILQAIGQLWLAGVAIDWQAFYADEYRHRLPLPTYPFERQRYWIDPPTNQLCGNQLHGNQLHGNQIVEAIASLDSQSKNFQSISSRSTPEDQLPSGYSSPTQLIPPVNQSTSAMSESRKQRLVPQLKEALETTSGLDIGGVDEVTTFLEMGLDSLSLTQVALALKKKFKVKITFRHLLEDYPNFGSLADFIDRSCPPDLLPEPKPEPKLEPAPAALAATVLPLSPPPVMTASSNSGQPNGNSNGHAVTLSSYSRCGWGNTRTCSAAATNYGATATAFRTGSSAIACALRFGTRHNTACCQCCAFNT